MNDLGTLASRTFDAVVFDMDETLIRSGPATLRSWTRWAIEYDLTEEQFEGTVGRPSAEVVEMLIPEGEREEASRKIEDYELGDTDDIVPYPGATRALAELPRDRVAIATSATEALMTVRLAAAGLPEPAVKVFIELVERGKPAPDSVLKACELLGVEASRVLVVEDAPAGVAGARAAGAASLGVLTTSSREALGADGVVGSLADVAWVVSDDGVRVRLA